jgi:hypothetical protein
VLAHEVPYLELVLVEEEIGSIEDFADEITCLTQEDADLTVTLLSDAEVRAAYLQRPVSRQERELRELRATHGVAVVNESFGPISRLGLEELLFQAGCPLVSLDRYFEVEAELQREYERAHPEPGVLFVRAAGNESSVLNGSTDTLQCRPGDLSQVLVGGYGPRGARSFFTNFGSCVDVYAPGELVVGVLPGGWLFPLSGTSFSTPLVSRLLVFESPAPFSADSARAALLALREPNRNIPRRYFPPDLALDVVAVLLSITEGVSSPPTMVPGPAERVSKTALRKALWPLRWVQRSRGLSR